MALFVVFTALFLWGFLRHPSWIPSATADMEYMWPYKFVWIESLKKGYPALWNPYSNLGQPFLANCNPGAYAPFNFLFFIFSTSYAFTWSYFFHFLISAFGTYLFIRSLGTGWAGAFLGGLAFAFSGYFMGHFWSGAPNIFGAAAWLPLIFFFLKRFLDLRRFSILLLAAGVFGLSLLEGMPQVNLYTLLIIGLYLAWAWFRKELAFKEALGAGVAFLAVGLSLGLCQLAPTFEFARYSNRWGFGWESIMRDSFNPVNLRFFIDPFFAGGPGAGPYHGIGGYAEVIIYLGLIPIFLAISGLGFLFKKSIVVWLVLVAVLTMSLAMADTTTVTHYVYLFFYKFFPCFSNNRVPSRILVLTTFSLACLAGMALDAWIRRWRGMKRLARPYRILLAAVIPAILLLGTAVDLYRFDTHFTECFNGCDAFFTDLLPPDLLKKVKDDPTYPRVQPRSTYTEYQILQNISTAFTDCTSFFIKTGRAYTEEQYLHPDTPLSDLIRLNFHYRPDGSQPNGRWQRIPGITESVWQDSEAYPRAFMVGGYEVEPDYNQAITEIRDEKVDPRQEVILTQEPSQKPEGPKGWVGEAKITRYDYNDVELEAANDRPCFLFLSDSFYPGWKAWVDGKAAPIYLADGAFRAIPLLNTGSHQVKMSYYPPIIVDSFFYSLFAWLALLIGWILRKRLDQWYSAR